MDPRQPFVLAAICSRRLTQSYPSALIGATDSRGRSIFEGKRVTALSIAEEEVHDLPIKVGGQHISTLQRQRVLSANE